MDCAWYCEWWMYQISIFENLTPNFEVPPLNIHIAHRRTESTLRYALLERVWMSSARNYIWRMSQLLNYGNRTALFVVSIQVLQRANKLALLVNIWMSLAWNYKWWMSHSSEDLAKNFNCYAQNVPSTVVHNNTTKCCILAEYADVVQ